MAKFKNFLLNEELGLGNLGPKLNDFMNNQWLDSKIHGAFVSSDFSGTEVGDTATSAGHPLHLPSTDLTIPFVERTGRITTLLLKKNPIYIRLSDGTEAHFSYDEYRRIQGKPELGKTMTMIFQRNPADQTAQHSKIMKAIVRD